MGETTRNFAHRPSEPSICSTRQPESLRHLDTETSRRCFGAIPLIEASRACAFRTTPRRGAPSLRQVERVTLRPHIALRNCTSEQSIQPSSRYAHLWTAASLSPVLDTLYPVEFSTVRSRFWCCRTQATSPTCRHTEGGEGVCRSHRRYEDGSRRQSGWSVKAHLVALMYVTERMRLQRCLDFTAHQ